MRKSRAGAAVERSEGRLVRAAVRAGPLVVVVVEVVRAEVVVVLVEVVVVRVVLRREARVLGGGEAVPVRVEGVVALEAVREGVALLEGDELVEAEERVEEDARDARLAEHVVEREPELAAGAVDVRLLERRGREEVGHLAEHVLEADDVVAQALHAPRLHVVEEGRVADVDDAVADAYLADEAPGDAAVAAGLRRATLAGRAVPAVCAAALRGVGVAEVLDAVVDYLPSPREALAGDGAAAGDGFAGFVFKVAHDARRGPLAYARAYRGSARPKEVLASSTGAVERPGQFLTPLGGGLEPAESWDAGDIVVLTGLRSARAGDTLVGPKGSPGFDAARRGAGLRLEDVDVPPPVFAVAAEPGSPSAAKALEAAAAILARDDPSLVVDVDGDTGQVVLRGLGELHLEVALERLRSDFGVDVTFGPPAVALREAPTAETRRPPFVYDRTLGESRLFCALELSLAPRAADVDGEAVYGGGPPRISLAPAARDALDGASKLHAGQDKRAKFPTSKAHISAVFHSFWLIFGRAIISWNGLEA